MARFPGATWDGEHSPSDPMTRYDIVCIHTIVGRAPAHAAHFSTFMDGRKPHQSRDTMFRSAANLEGNHRIIAIENEDTAPGKSVPTDVTDWPPLTDSQIEDCAQILAWANREHGVPLQLCPDSRPGSRGLAYHRQGIDGNFGPGTPFKYPGRVSGGETWTTSYGKVCPTDARIAQLPLILERAKQINNPEDPMANYEKQLDEILAQAKAANEGVAELTRQIGVMRGNVQKRDLATRKLVREALKEVSGPVTIKLEKVLDLLDEDPEGEK